MRFLFLLFVFNFQFLHAQELTTELSSREVLSGHYFTAEIILKDLDGEVSPPDFGEFEIVGGPNQSRQVQIVNGDMSQTTTYTYYLRPRREGSVYFPPVTVESDGKFYETEPLEITVLPNPENRPQPSDRRESLDPFEGFFNTPNDMRPRADKPARSQRRKRKIYRI